MENYTRHILDSGHLHLLPLVTLVVKNPSANTGDRGEFDPWVRKIPWRRAWQATLVFLPGEFLGQRSLVGYSPWGHKELDTTEST